jgi:hypothetical protein
VLILRGDVNLMYTVIASRRVYRIGPVDPSLLESLDAYEFSKGMIVSHEKVGTETVKGQICDKYRFSSATDKNKSSAEPDSATSGYIWISQSNHLPVMSETEGATTEWENLDIGPQDPSLFACPRLISRGHSKTVRCEAAPIVHPQSKFTAGHNMHIARFSGVNDSVENSGKIVNKSGNSLCDEVNG